MSSFYQTQTEDYESLSETGDYFKIWPEPKNPNEVWPTTAVLFSILIQHSYIYSTIHLSPDDDVNDLGDLIFCQLDDQTLEVERDLLMNNDALMSRHILEDKLCAVGIPFWSSMIDSMLKCARDMAENKEFESYKVFHMHARVDIIVDEPDELFPEHDEDEDEVEEFPDDMEVEPVIVPASESAIDKLEVIKIEDESRSCVVCLEEILLGSQATRMPCAHLFHGDCILNWLRKSKFCPLCRSVLD